MTKPKKPNKQSRSPKVSVRATKTERRNREEDDAAENDYEEDEVGSSAFVADDHDSDDDPMAERLTRHGRIHRDRKNRKDPFGPDGVFGRGGVFGPDGPFGANGPFGAGGPFGRSGPFGKGFPFGEKAGRGPERAARTGRRRRMFSADELRLVLLAMIAEEPRHGYDCIRALEDASDGSYAPSPGSVYPILSMLSDEGQIAEREGESAKRVYETTATGDAELADRAEEIDELLDKLGTRARRARAAKSPDLMRSIGNLASAMTTRATRGDFSEETRRKAVALIDEVAARIERL